MEFLILVGRVAKCQFFYTEQNLQPKFSPKKSVQIAKILVPKSNKTNKKDEFGKQMLKMKLG